jgi:hypothetical protein
VKAAINMGVRDVTKKLVSVFVGQTMMVLNVIFALRDMVWIMDSANLCFNANLNLQAMALLIAIIMAPVIKTSKMDSLRSVGAILASKMTAMSFVVNAKIQCLLIPTVSRDIG